MSEAEIRPKAYTGRVRTPTVLQMEAVECGAAALGIILGHFGRHVSLPELRAACGVSRDGSKASSIVKAARTWGLEANGYKKELSRLYELAPPYVVFWHFNHFLVVEGFDARGVYLNDPATGPRMVSYEEFDEGYTGVVLVMTPGPAFVPGGSRPALWPALAERLRGNRQAVAYGLASGLLLVVPNLAVPVFSQVLVDQVLVQGLSDWLRPLLIGMAIAAVLTAALKGLQLAVLRRLAIKLSVMAGGGFLAHTLRLPIGFFAQRHAGEIAERANAHPRIAETIARRLAEAAIDMVLMAAFALVLVAFNWGLGLAVLALGALNFAVLRASMRHGSDHHMRLSLELGKAYGVSIAGLQSIETLKSAGLENDFFARWSGYYTKAVNTMQGLSLFEQRLGALPVALGAITHLVVLVGGGYQVIEGHMSLGMLVAFQSLTASFTAPVQRLVGMGAVLQQLEADLARQSDLLGHPTDPLAADDEAPLPAGAPARLSGHVALEDVSFGYSPLEPALIEHLSLTIKPGQRVALVGGSGSGKSTIAKLVAGLYQPWSGTIRFDGVPRERLPRAVVAGSVALVDQDLFLFAGSVRDNVTLWDATASEQAVLKACKDAEIHDVVMGLPGGYDGTLLEGAANLSGGQRQRLEIARALAGNPAIVVLDEATSALDAESERMVDQHLRRRGCTCLIVAHRLSTIRDCDEIIVLERGKVVQRGTHAGMKDVDGPYARLIRVEGEALEAADA